MKTVSLVGNNLTAILSGNTLSNKPSVTTSRPQLEPLHVPTVNPADLHEPMRN